MATRSLRQKKKNISHLKRDLFGWFTWGLELLMLVSTLFWAIEANAANGVQWQPNWFQTLEFRAPASGGVSRLSKDFIPHSWLGYHDYSSALENGDSKGLRKFLAQGKVFRAQQTIYFGDTLSASFRRSPLYVPTTITLFRFRTF